ncbi:hypothetical protein CHKEEEPN_0871 [Methylorubrum podarium]|nr:hypothetical protein CHKEEEPN_0871 [Methylorubrum podarium]
MVAAVAALEADALVEPVAQAGLDHARDRAGAGQAQDRGGLGQDGIGAGEEQGRNGERPEQTRSHGNPFPFGPAPEERREGTEKRSLSGLAAARPRSACWSCHSVPGGGGARPSGLSRPL